MMRKRSEVVAKDKPAEEFPSNGTKCSECNELQYKTPGGLSCKNGHGGAEPAEDNAFINEATANGERQARKREKQELAANGGVGPNVFGSGDEGEEVTVTIGESAYSPRQYNSFRVGPFTSTTRVRQGETRNDAARRVLAQLQVLETEEFNRKIAVFERAWGRITEGRG